MSMPNSPNTYGIQAISQPGKEQDLENFKAHMEFKTLGKRRFRSVDVPQISDYPTDPEQILIVDVGGSFGHDIIDFHAAFPNLPWKLVLQDLPATISAIAPDFPKDIQAQTHDFFTSQPVEHAKIYYLHMILHDWPDDSCRKILSNIITLMKNGYSKILLSEIVIPDTNAN
ncbi:S-adenosyl-L-methionine-dependent methyltransferase [Lindgomyces ingoldianus]|uniref:S-adenosyl-L-methionine-dependent methyltransferase n=1 Tax=Lindgomyces ingoldianus TaxID=673940 RepID=A0ACB6Q790_9PLEO|nr:S-adenosyl-L-methionine-dependent methyltransferase [Lindgomyces ingoldianus]KAF2462778.1 S-adenosyl-L-methionine-dependent methyltransferase [Lindgomyces ingoldianus]